LKYGIFDEKTPQGIKALPCRQLLAERKQSQTIAIFVLGKVRF